MPTPDPRTVPWPARTTLPRTGAPARPVRTPAVRRRTTPGHRVRTLVRGLTAMLSADWTVSVHDGPVVVCTYPPTRLPSAWSLARAARRCWPGWQTHLSAQQQGSGG
jgi:hypothetical protein